MHTLNILVYILVILKNLEQEWHISIKGVSENEDRDRDEEIENDLLPSR